MTVTKCAECPFLCEYECNYEPFVRQEVLVNVPYGKDNEIHPLCPIASGKPFEINFKTIEEKEEVKGLPLPLTEGKIKTNVKKAKHPFLLAEPPPPPKPKK